MRPLAYACAILLAALGLSLWHLHLAGDALASERAGRAADAKAAQLAAEQARANVSAERTAQAVKIMRSQDVAFAKSQKVADDAKRAAVAGGGLRIAAQSYAASSPAVDQAAPTTCPSPSADPRAAVLADMLSQCGDRYRAVAELADQAMIAGRACEAWADAVIGP